MSGSLNYLDQILAAQKRGEALGLPSICSAHPFVLKETLKVCQTFRVVPLIEATCNQVNQFGGYTGMTPADFVRYVRGLADEVHFPFEQILLGGDHLGPSVWQNEPAESALQKAEALVREYVQAGFAKIHLDCSMRLADDPEGALDVEVSARRAARLAQVAEAALTLGPSPKKGEGSGLRYVIGTEVPVPGGATEHESGVRATEVRDAARTLEVTREAFMRAGLKSAWERVAALVVQPGVEFGDDFVLPYQPEAARALSRFIESQPLIYEAHSTDYQTRTALANLVRDHFAILKVGPGLTFAFREAVFALALIENEIVPAEARSNLMNVLDAAMTRRPEHWKKYYRGTEAEQAFKRKFSLSDRVRYYWTDEQVQAALARLFQNLSAAPLPRALVSQFAPWFLEAEHFSGAPQELVQAHIRAALEEYWSACA